MELIQMEYIYEYIKPELLVLIPVLYFIGMGIKKAEAISDNRIPLILGVAGVVLSMVYILASGAENIAMAVFTGFTQGVLCAGASVYVNQLIKQVKNK